MPFDQQTEYNNASMQVVENTQDEIRNMQLQHFDWGYTEGMKQALAMIQEAPDLQSGLAQLINYKKENCNG